MKFQALAASVLSSITPLTGALVGGLGVAAPIFAGTVAEIMFGRPSSTTVVAFPIAFVFGTGGALIGAAIGFAVRRFVMRSHWARQMDRRVVGMLLLLAVGIPSVLAVRSVLSYELLNAPGVIESTGLVVRHEAVSPLEPRSPAVLIWASHPEVAGQVQELHWNERAVRVTVNGGQLVMHAGDVTSAAVDLRGLDYVREIHAVTATLGGGTSESLALLARLRATGRRELLLIFDSRGTLRYRELLERRTNLLRSPVIWSAGPESERQEFIVDLGAPLRYAGTR